MTITMAVCAKCKKPADMICAKCDHSTYCGTVCYDEDKNNHRLECQVRRILNTSTSVGAEIPRFDDDDIGTWKELDNVEEELKNRQMQENLKNAIDLVIKPDRIKIQAERELGEVTKEIDENWE